MSIEPLSHVQSDEDLERLTIPNGFRIDNETMAIEIVYDGKEVIFRSEEGELVTMDTLCYLDHVMGVCIDTVLDDREKPSDKSAAEMAHVIGTMIQHLHSQMHIIAMQQRGGLAGLLGALAGAQVGEEGGDLGDLMPVGAFVLGPDGLQQVDMNDPETLAALLGGGPEALEGEFTVEDEGDGVGGASDGEPVEEIIIGDIPKKKR